jgi:hypothetical protein
MKGKLGKNEDPEKLRKIMSKIGSYGLKYEQETIETELKQLTDYGTFIVQDTGEAVPNGRSILKEELV